MRHYLSRSALGAFCGYTYPLPHVRLASDNAVLITSKELSPMRFSRATAAAPLTHHTPQNAKTH